MKKRIALILAFALCLSLCACGQEAAPAPTQQDASNVEATQPTEIQQDQVAEPTADNDAEETVGDDTYWTTETWNDGTIVQTHYAANHIPIEQIHDNEATGDHTEIQYYESGNMKSRDTYHAERKERIFMEYYENDSVMYFLQETDDGHKHEEKYNEAGYTTYYYDSNMNMEFFADDVGELLKCVSNGQTYEGDAIPSDERRIFEQVRQVAVTDTVMTQGEDGTNSTTTTYADGTVTTSGTTADGFSFYESISANGDRTYQEYHTNGNTKLSISESGDSYQETRGDEDGYWTYFHLKAPGYELEITCDETGKVDKVLLNGQVQTDIEQYVQGMFFRSW